VKIILNSIGYRLFYFTVLALVAMPSVILVAQTFTRSVLPGNLDTPWEIIYGPDDFLWISESGGKISRVNPQSGERTIIFTAKDYYPGSILERPDCGANIGAATYGMALHPDFVNEDSSYIFLFYSYNNGTDQNPETLFKIARLKWDAENETITDTTDIVTGISNGYDHWGGRMIAIKQKSKNYLYYSVGDHGSNNPDCYEDSLANPNNYTQDTETDNGKIHRVYLNGSIPEDNPISGNSFFTRGHRNPQGLVYNSVQDVIYEIEHGHKSDDEVNILKKGMNYGWKNVHGYHDGNIEGELDYINNYTPNPEIEGDSLIEAFYSWGTEVVNSSNNSLWPTVAPSDGFYYADSTIPEWTNSLLVVTLKNGNVTDQELYQFKLTEDGKGLADSTEENPNPRKFFAGDQNNNGRLRDLTFSPDGSTLYLITNNWNGVNPIIVYKYDAPVSISEKEYHPAVFGLSQNYPNPFNPSTTITFSLPEKENVRLFVYDILGREIIKLADGIYEAGEHKIVLNGSNLPSGIYFYRIEARNFSKTKKLVLTK